MTIKQVSRNIILNRIQALGFTHAEAVSIRLIELRLTRWNEGIHSGKISFDELGFPCRYGRRMSNYHAGCIRRLNGIVAARNNRECKPFRAFQDANGTHIETLFPEKWIYAYVHADHRGPSVFLVPASELPDASDAELERFHARGLAVID